MQNNKKPRISNVSLSESTVAVSLSAIRRRCQNLLDEDGEIPLDFDDLSDSQKLRAAANNPSNHSG